jgi:hypothetical protein
MRRRALFSPVLALLGLSIAAPVQAAAPLEFGPFTDTYSGYGFSCDSFDVNIDGAATSRTYVYLDEASGQLTRVVRHTSAPHDVLTNTSTGASIVVRAEFDETMVPIPGTDEATKTIVGFRYLVNQPGAGVVIRDVGRIIYGDFEQTILLWEAGKHDAETDEQVGAAFCAALS